MSIHNENLKLIRDPGAIVNGNKCDVFGDRSIINGNECNVYGNSCIINGDNCRVYGTTPIINGTGTRLITRTEDSKDGMDVSAILRRDIQNVHSNMTNIFISEINRVQNETTARIRNAYIRFSEASARPERQPSDLAIVTSLSNMTDVKTSNDKNQCIVCLENEKIVVFISCGHRLLCASCTKTMYDKTKTCPTCRKSITGVLRVFD